MARAERVPATTIEGGILLQRRMRALPTGVLQPRSRPRYAILTIIAEGTRSVVAGVLWRALEQPGRLLETPDG